MRTLFIFVATLIFCGSNLYGQSIRPANDLMPTAYTTNQPYGRDAFYFFLNDGGASATSLPIWSWAATAGSPNPLPSTTVLSLDPNSGKVTGNFSSISGARTYIINVTATFSPPAGGGAATPPVSKVYTLVKSAFTTPPTCLNREYALVLDLSGSMNFPSSKWTTLQASVKKFLLTINPLLTASDRVAVIFFNGTTATVRKIGNFRDPSWLNSDSDIQKVLFDNAPSVHPNSATPLGAGLKTSLDGFFSPFGATLRTIVLFTDGMQNQPPLVIGAGMNIIDSAPQVDLSDATHNDIKIMTIGVGAGTAFADALRLLSNPNDEYTQADVITSPELDVFFTKTIPVSLAGCTPRILDYRSGITKGEGNEISESFRVNRFVNQLVIRLSSYGGRLYYARLLKDGDSIPIAPVPGDNSVVFTIDFPFYFPDSMSRHDAGEWEVRFMGEQGVEYDVVAIADDDYIKSRIDVGGGEKFFAGDEIPVSFNLHYADAPLDSATVEAILLRPGDDLGDLAAEIAVDKQNLISIEPETLTGQAKLEYLLNDSNFVENLRKEGLLKSLNPVGNGNYVASFKGNESVNAKYNNNEVTGTYRVVARCSGSTPLGPFVGWATKCVFVDFSRPADITLQEVLIDLGPDADGGHNYQLVLTPVNKFGRKIGPAQENRIKVSVTQGTVGPIEDNLDGSYSTKIRVPEGSNPTVSVHVIDMQQPVLQSPLNGIGNARAFGLSAHAGATLPLGNLNSPYNSQFMAEVDLTYRFGGGFGAELVGGYYGFQPDFYILGGTLFGTYRLFSGSALNVYGGLGVGVYGPKNEDVTLGLGFKAGFSRALGSHWETGLEFGYYSLPKPDYQFGTSAICFKYFF